MKALLTATFVLLAILGTNMSVQAGECIQSQTLGTWVNPFAGNRSDLTRLEIKEMCGPTTVPHIQVKAFTACAPRDCTWGRSIAHRSGKSGLAVTYNTFFAKRTVVVSINGRRMDATVTDDFHDPKKSTETRSFVLWREQK